MDLFENTLYQRQLEEIIYFLPPADSSILITGATGLIGSFLVDCLIKANRDYGRNFHIYALGRSQEKLMSRFGYATDSDHLHLMAADICEPLGNSQHYDYIIHAASNADPKSYAIYPAETLLTNILGTKSVLDYAKENKETRVLLASTFEVYGDAGKNGIITEESTGIIDFHVLRNCYPSSKVSAELLCQSYAEEYGVDVVIGRLCGIYGPTMQANDSKAQAQFIRNAVAGEDIVLKSKGEQVRSYCYVADAVKALFTILLHGEKKEAYNISDENSVMSIADLAKMTAEVGGVNVVFNMPDAIEAKGFSRPVDVRMDNSKLKAIGWSCIYTASERCKETIEILNGNK